MESKQRIRVAIESALHSKSNVPKSVRLSLTLNDLCELTQGFDTLGPSEAGHCADLLDDIRMAEHGDARCVPSVDLIVSLRLEWACGHLRPAGSTMESPQKRYKMIENFKMRWKALESRNLFRNERSLSKEVRTAFDLVQKLQTSDALPAGWETVLMPKSSILQALNKYCKSAEHALGPSFLIGVQKDISTGVYKNKIDRSLNARRDKTATPMNILQAIEKSKASRVQLAAETSKHADPLAETLKASEKFASAQPRRANITAEPKKNARTMSWESQQDAVVAPQPPAKKSKLDPLVTVALEEQLKARKLEAPKSPAPGTVQLPSGVTRVAPEEQLKARKVEAPKSPAPGTVRLPSGVTRVRTPGSENASVSKYERWKPEEEADLIAGVKKYGIGKWARILRDENFAFASRDNVNLKDKWRTLVRKDPDELSKWDKKKADYNL